MLKRQHRPGQRLHAFNTGRFGSGPLTRSEPSSATSGVIALRSSFTL
jgi:hypothetical protein